MFTNAKYIWWNFFLLLFCTVYKSLAYFINVNSLLTPLLVPKPIRSTVPA